MAVESRAEAAPVQKHTVKTNRIPILRYVAMVLVAVVAFGTAATATAIRIAEGQISVVDVDEFLGTDRPEEVDNTPKDPSDPHVGESLTILIMGSDSRDGDNSTYGVPNQGMRSDTTIIAHISGDREHLSFTSIPRDSVVDIPECFTTSGATTAPHRDQFNHAFATGWDAGGDITSAVACTIRTVETNTKVRIDEFIVVDFSGFERIVNALGGVEIDVPEPLRCRKAKLDIAAGVQTLDGTQALAYARARMCEEGSVTGSDLERIDRQQDLLAATMETAISKNILTDLNQLYNMGLAATSSLTTSPGLSTVGSLTGLAYSLRGINADKTHFVTVPNVEWSQDRNRVIWTAEADDLWEAIRRDDPDLYAGFAPDILDDGGSGEVVDD